MMPKLPGRPQSRAPSRSLLSYCAATDAANVVHPVTNRLKRDVAHGLTVSPPNRDRLTMRTKPLIMLNLILGLSKDGAKFPRFFRILRSACNAPQILLL